MKHLVEYINEAKYNLGPDYEVVEKDVIKQLEDTLPKWPNHKSDNLRRWQKEIAGKFVYNTREFNKYKCENSNYIGYKIPIYTTLDPEANNIRVDVMKRAIEDIFGVHIIEEGVFDDNVKNTKLPEYEYINKLYYVLSKFFNTKDFSKVPFMEADWDRNVPAGKLRQLPERPTAEKDGFKVALWSIEPDLKVDRYNRMDDGTYFGIMIKINIIIYEDKKR